LQTLEDIRKPFEQDGYVTRLTGLTKKEMSPYVAAFNELEKALGRERAEVCIVNHHEDHAFIWDLATQPAILDAVEQLIGRDLVLLGTHIFCKYPAKDTGKEAFVAWHQDVIYWGLKPPVTVTAWLAIDDVDVANGAMRIVPRTHTMGILDHGKSDKQGNLLSVNQAIDEAKFDGSKIIDIELDSGQFSLHHGMTIHGSAPNYSSRRRCGMTIRFTTPEVELVQEPNRVFPWTPIIVRGEDRFQRNAYGQAPTFK